MVTREDPENSDAQIETTGYPVGNSCATLASRNVKRPTFFCLSYYGLWIIEGFSFSADGVLLFCNMERPSLVVYK